MRKSIIIPIVALLAVVITIASSCHSETEMMFDRYYTSGSMLYKQHCENCHGANGDGLGALIPPLHDSVYLKKNSNKLACFIKNGLADTITLAGNKYSGKMPAQDNLSAIEVAEILTYVTNSFGNKLGVVEAPKVNADWAACEK